MSLDQMIQTVMMQATFIIATMEIIAISYFLILVLSTLPTSIISRIVHSVSRINIGATTPSKCIGISEL